MTGRRLSPDGICPRCGGPRSVYSPGHTYCPKCRQEAYDPTAQRVRQLRITYGITLEQYKTLYRSQKGRCAICNKAKKVLDVDHVHGQKGLESVRGLLCKECNRGLGLFGDAVEGLEKALEYLQAYYSGH